MKKVCTLIICLLILAPTIQAEILQTKYIRLYQNGDRQEDIDMDGGTITANRGDELKFVTRIENIFNETIQAKIKIVIYSIDNGDDIEKTIDWYDIEKFEERTKTLTVNIPDDADEDIYDLQVKVYGKNENETQDNYDYELEVDYNSETVTDSYLLKEYFNVSSICFDIISQNKGLLANLTQSLDYVNRYTLCQAKQGGLEQKNTDLQSRYNESCQLKDECQSELQLCQEEKNDLKIKQQNMVTEQICKDREEEAIKEANSKMRGYILWAAVIGIIVFLFMRNRGKKTDMPTTKIPPRTI